MKKHDLWLLILLIASVRIALAEETGKSPTLGGSIRTIGAGVQNYDFPPFFGSNNEDTEGLSQTLLRLTAFGKARGVSSYEIHAVQGLDYTTVSNAPDGSGLNLISVETRYRAVDTSIEWLDEDKWTATLWFDRFNVQVPTIFGDITAGRQAITYGKAYFWNPLDVFLPFDPRQFDREYKPGVDAIRLQNELGPFSGFELVGAFGRTIDTDGDYKHGDKVLDTSWDGSALLVRAFTTAHDWDLSFQAGKVYGGNQTGAGVVGEIMEWQIRAEAAYLNAYDQPPLPLFHSGDVIEDHWLAVLGTGHHFESSLEVDVEYLYNGAAHDDLDAGLIRVESGGSQHLSKHLLGVLVSYELHPLVMGQVVPILSLDDGSLQVQPGLTCSLSDESDLLLGATLNFGDRPTGKSILDPNLQSEFGSFVNTYYGEIKLYF